MKIENALIIGGGHGIGLGLAQSLLESNPGSNIYVTYRKEELASELLQTKAVAKRVDPSSETELEEYFEQLPKLDLIVCAIGALQNPEKSVRDLNIEALTKAFIVNAAIPSLICKHAKKCLDRNTESSMVFLSAMVGSISDNAIGGWYGYRASKAALNQLIKTASIEYTRGGYKTKLALIHPGTTETELSKNFLGGVKHRIWTPKESAENILHVIDHLNESGVFKNWDGTTIPW